MLVDEVAIEGELANERVHLPQRHGHWGAPLEIAAEEAVGGHAELQGGVRGVIHDGGAVLLRERQDALDAADTGRAVVPVDVRAEGADLRAGGLGGAP